eukprot:7322540-Prymnesium_polylepis.1
MLSSLPFPKCTPALLFKARTHLARAELRRTLSELNGVARAESARLAELDVKSSLSSMSEIDDLAKAVDQLIVWQKELNESTCEAVLDSTAGILFGSDADKKRVPFQRVPFQNCHVTASYEVCSIKQAN